MDPCGPQGAVTGVSFRKRDACRATGAQRRGDVLRVAHRHRLGAQRPLPSKWALATVDRKGYMPPKIFAAVAHNYGTPSLSIRNSVL